MNSTLSVFFTALLRVGILIAFALPGFILQKLKKFPEGAIGTMCTIVIYVSQPMLALYSFIEAEFKSELLLNMLYAFLLSIVFVVGFFLIARAFFHKVTLDKKARVCSLAASLPNCGFMGIPVIQVLFNNPEITIYALIFMIVFNITLWTLCVFEITGEKKYVSIKKALLNLPTVVLVVALPVFFLNLGLTKSDNVVLQSVMMFCEKLKDFNLTLPMIILGIRLAQIDFKKILGDRDVYLVSLVKLIVFPLLALGIMALISLIPSFNFDNNLFVSLLICCAMPTATMTISLAETFDGDKEAATKSTLMTTIFSVFTIPLFVTLLTVLGII
jgi:hypothetical protein